MKDIRVVKELISNKVSLGDVLAADENIPLGESETQLSCPFHGADLSKSARYYRSTDTMYCWVCKKSWDLYGYVSERDGVGFGKAVESIVDKYKVDISKAPEAIQRVDYSVKRDRSSKADGKKVALAQIRSRLIKLKGVIDTDKYVRLLFAYSVLKNLTAEDRFLEDANKIASLIVKIERGH